MREGRRTVERFSTLVSEWKTTRMSPRALIRGAEGREKNDDERNVRRAWLYG